MPSSKNRKRQRGAAIIYFSAIMLVSAIVAAVAVRQYQPKKNYDWKSETVTKLNEIDNAIINFVASNGRLPCPAAPNVAIGDANYGVESRDTSFQCNAASIYSSGTGTQKYMGAIPIKTLGLSEKDGLDGWGNKIEYVVSKDLYIAKAENATSNFISNVGLLTVQSNTGTTLESAGAYILLSRGENQLSAWGGTSSTRNTVAAIGSVERENTECAVGSTSCGGASFDNVFKTGDVQVIDDIMLFKNKTELLNSCKNVSGSNKCNLVPCSTFGTTTTWVPNGNTTLTVTKTNLPYFNIPTQANLGLAYALTMKINSLTASRDIILMYDYKLQGTTTVKSMQIAKFNSLSSFNGKFNISSIGQTVSIPFAEANHIPLKLYFVLGSGSGNVSMGITNLSVTARPVESQDELRYDIWTSLNCLLGSDYYDDDEDDDDGSSAQSSDGNIYDDIYEHLCGGCSTSSIKFDSRFPDSPTLRTRVAIAEGYTNYGDNYASSIYGYFTPDETAEYKFYLASTENSELWLSPDSNPNNAVKIATRTANSLPRAWTTSGGSPSAKKTLKSGVSYFFRVIHVATTGTGDNLALGCSKITSSATTPVAVLGLGNDTVGCAGTLSSADLHQILTQPVCQ